MLLGSKYVHVPREMNTLGIGFPIQDQVVDDYGAHNVAPRDFQLSQDVLSVDCVEPVSAILREGW